MKALLDTNIIIHRETKTPVDSTVGTLFYWLGKLKYELFIHPATREEINKNKNKSAVKAFTIKMDSYGTLRTTQEIDEAVERLCGGLDNSENDINDTKLLNELYCGRVDILLSEDVRLTEKASILGISERVYSIKRFLEYAQQSFPGLVEYDVLEIRKTFFSEVNLKDSFFDSFRESYPDFDGWFNKKFSDEVYILQDENGIHAFLYIKIENEDELYYDISPIFAPKKRLKIGTLKVTKTGIRLGERFFKIIFDNARQNNVDEIYVTIFDDDKGKNILIKMLEKWGFFKYGTKGKAKELVFVRKFSKEDNNPVNREFPKLTYPYISQGADFYMLSILPEFHTDLFPDSLIRGEAIEDFVDSTPHRNSISKCYVSTAPMKNLKHGDALIFYRTGGKYKGVATTVAIVENIVLNIESEEDLILATRNRTVYDESGLRRFYRRSLAMPEQYKIFIINFLYVGTLNKRMNLKKLIEEKIIDKAPRGIVKISKDSFAKMIINNY